MNKELKKCINCAKANMNIKLRKKRDENHSAHEYKICDTYKAKLEHVIELTNYPYRPIDVAPPDDKIDNKLNNKKQK